MLKQQIGSYKIISKLGEGGMAHVYLAEKGALKKKVALKVLREDFNSNRHVRGRFLSEARRMAHLQHPNVVAVNDLVDEPDFVAMEMEYIAGTTLKEHLNKNGALPDEEIERLLPQMKAALDYIHEKGFVHRDVKPSNFMLTPEGSIKLTDFGIAKNTEDAGQDYTGTATGMQMGTPKYMSPEQVRSTKNVTAQSDIYSLGVVLWEMVTGKVPYDIETESTFDVFEKIVHQDLSPTETKWDALIERATRKETDERVFNLKSIKQENEVRQTIKEQPEKNEQTREKAWSWWTSHEAYIMYAVITIFIVTAIIFTPENKKTSKNEDFKIGKETTYNSVKIGNQIWMTENLNVDKFRNGDPIPHAKTVEKWKKAGKNGEPAWCYYHNNPDNGDRYGKLYNWYAVNDSRGLAPEGWKIPSDEDWSRLSDFLGGESVAGKKMKSTDFWAENDGESGNGTNESGFSGLPGGGRYFDGTFNNIGYYGKWWSSTEYNTYGAWSRSLYYDVGYVDRGTHDKTNGISCRCLRD